MSPSSACWGIFTSPLWGGCRQTWTPSAIGGRGIERGAHPNNPLPRLRARGSWEGKFLARPEPRPYSRTQSSRQRRPVERTKAVMRQPTDIGLEEGAQVRHAVFEHRDAVDAHAPGEALVLVGIEPAIAQHVRMHHAAAENFHPILAFAEADLALIAAVLDVDLKRGLGEREE